MTDEDPFEDLGGDREGDPFESLDRPEDGEAPADSDDTAAEPDDSVVEADPSPAPTGQQGGDTDPFEDLDGREGNPFESLDAFEDRSVDEVDPDVVWQTLASAETRGSVTDDSERTYADVSKHSYCEQCEHFSPPPEISCTHEGTEIVEFRDMETVRVVDCPIVAERRRLERRG